MSYTASSDLLPGPVDVCNQSRFLRALPREECERIVAEATHHAFPLNYVFFRRGEVPRFAYLLTSGMASVMYTSEHGNSVELSMLGNEGPIGWLLLLGPLPTGAECNMQVPGSGYRLPFAAMQHIFDTSPAVRRRVLELAQQKAMSAYQQAACNRLHRAGMRFARWLLTASDRAEVSDLPITQEFLGYMLGTRRTTVAEEAGALQRIGAIEYSRGHLRILDRALLESRACECYRVIRSHYDDLYSRPLPR